MNSRAKGKAGELELASLLRLHGFDARRGVQYQGGPGSPDVVGLPGCHVEVKRKERGNPYEWLEQATKEAADGATPVVFHRRNRHPWIVVLAAEDFLGILHDAEHGAAPYDPVADGIGSHNDALKEIRRRIKAGEEDPPTTGYFASKAGGAR